EAAAAGTPEDFHADHARLVSRRDWLRRRRARAAVGPRQHGDLLPETFVRPVPQLRARRALFTGSEVVPRRGGEGPRRSRRRAARTEARRALRRLGRAGDGDRAPPGTVPPASSARAVEPAPAGRVQPLERTGISFRLGARPLDL